MIGMVLVTHGRLADEFVDALEHVVGKQEQVSTVCIGPDDDMEQRRKDILKSVAKVDQGKGVVLLTDMFGGTPSNLAISVIDKANVEVIAGINLPMLIKLAQARGSSEFSALVEAAQAAGKPLVILKAGRNAESAAAAASHTGALAGAYACHQAAFRQWGILEADNSDELFDIVEAFALTTKRLRGRRIGILTNSGGIGVLCADQLGANGLEVPAFESATEEALAADGLHFQQRQSILETVGKPYSAFFRSVR